MTSNRPALRFEMQRKVRQPDVDENEHPRDRKGRFIETGAEVRIWGGQTGTVVRNVGGGKIEVQRADGRNVIVHRNYLTVTASADGGEPIEDEADAPDLPVEQASPDAEEVPELADGEDVALPDRGDAPDRLVDEVNVGETQNGRTVGEYIDGPSAIDGWVVGFTDAGGPIVRTDEGQDWPLLPDADMAPDPDGPEMPPELLGESNAVDPTTAEPGDLDDETIASERGRLQAEYEAERDRLIAEGWEDGVPAPTLDALQDREWALADESYRRAGVTPRREDEGPSNAPRPIRDRGEASTPEVPTGAPMETEPTDPAEGVEPESGERQPTDFPDATGDPIELGDRSISNTYGSVDPEQFYRLDWDSDTDDLDASYAINPMKGQAFRIRGNGVQSAGQRYLGTPDDRRVNWTAEDGSIGESILPPTARIVPVQRPEGARRSEAEVAQRQNARRGRGEEVDPLRDPSTEPYDDPDEANGLSPAAQQFVDDARAAGRNAFDGSNPDPDNDAEHQSAKYEAGRAGLSADVASAMDEAYAEGWNEMAAGSSETDVEYVSPPVTDTPIESMSEDNMLAESAAIGQWLVDNSASPDAQRARERSQALGAAIAEQTAGDGEPAETPTSDSPEAQRLIGEARAAGRDASDGGEPDPSNAPTLDALRYEAGRAGLPADVTRAMDEAYVEGWNSATGSSENDGAQQSTLNSVNPSSSGVFEDYASGREFRANAPLADNMTTLAETEGADPTEPITVYRGVPDGETAEGGIRPGDFVTTDRQLAQDYAGTGEVIETSATYGDVLDDRDEPGGGEYIYRPGATPSAAPTPSEDPNADARAATSAAEQTLIDFIEGMDDPLSMTDRQRNNQSRTMRSLIANDLTSDRVRAVAQDRLDALADNTSRAPEAPPAPAAPDTSARSEGGIETLYVGATVTDGTDNFQIVGTQALYDGESDKINAINFTTGEVQGFDVAPGTVGSLRPIEAPPEALEVPDNWAEDWKADNGSGFVSDARAAAQGAINDGRLDPNDAIDAIVAVRLVNSLADAEPEGGVLYRGLYLDGSDEADEFVEDVRANGFAEALGSYSLDRNTATQFATGSEGDGPADSESAILLVVEGPNRSLDLWPGTDEPERLSGGAFSYVSDEVDSDGMRVITLRQEGVPTPRNPRDGMASDDQPATPDDVERRAAPSEPPTVPERAPEPSTSTSGGTRGADLTSGDRVVVDGRPATIEKVGSDMLIDDVAGGQVRLQGRFDDGAMLNRVFEGDQRFAPVSADGAGGGDDKYIDADRFRQPEPAPGGESVYATGSVRPSTLQMGVRQRERFIALSDEQRIEFNYLMRTGGGDINDSLTRAAAFEGDGNPEAELSVEGDINLPDPGWGKPYGGNEPMYDTPQGPVFMFRRGQRVRFYNSRGEQVGPEQANVAPAVAFASNEDGWGPYVPEEDAADAVDRRREALANVPALRNQQAAARFIVEASGADPEMADAVQAALGTRIAKVRGMYPAEGWERIQQSGNSDLLAMAQAAHGGIGRTVVGDGNRGTASTRRAWDPEKARAGLARLAENDPTLPAAHLIGQRVAIDVIDMDAPMVIGQPAATRRIEGVVQSVTPEYTWSQRVLIVDDSGERHSQVFRSGGVMPTATDPTAEFDHPARAIANGDPSPITFTYQRNPQSLGADADPAAFGRDIEPAGRYMLVVGGDYELNMARERGWQTGEVQFQRPLHLDFGGTYGEDDNWKNRLSAHYGGLTGRSLSDAVRADGYDAIMTNDAYGDSEVVDLSNGAAEVTPPTPAVSASGLDDRWQVTGGGLYRSTVSQLRSGDVIYTEGDGTTASPVALPRSPQTGYLSDYQKRQRTVARVDGAGRERTVHFTDGTSTGAEGGDRNGAAYTGQAPVFGVPERDREAMTPEPSLPPVEEAEATAFRAGYDAYGADQPRAPAASASVRDLLDPNAQVGDERTRRVMEAFTNGYDEAANDAAADLLRSTGGDDEEDALLRSLISPLPDLSRDPEGLSDEELTAAIKGIDDNLITIEDAGDRRDLLIYRARLVSEQNRRREPVDTSADVTVEPVAARDLTVGQTVIFEDGTVATIDSINDADGLVEVEYRDSEGRAGSYFADPSAQIDVVRADGDGPVQTPVPEQEDNPEPASDQQVLAGNLAPGDRVWLGGTKVEVLAVEGRDEDIVAVTLRWPDRRTETLPFGRQAVLDRADDQFLPDSSPLDSETPTSRPVLYTYQRRNIVALGLDADDDPMVAEAARRIRLRQPLAAAHSAALATRLAEMADEQPDTGRGRQRQRMLLRLAAANNAASIEAGGRGVNLPEMPNADIVTKGRPADAGVGDQIAFVDGGGNLVQGRVSNLRSLMSGRLAEVTIEQPDGTERTVMLTRNTDVYVLPDLPDPTPVPQANGVPELVQYGQLRVGDRVRIPDSTELFDDEQSLDEAMVVEAGERDGQPYAVLDVHSFYSNEPEQRLLLTVDPRRQGTPPQVVRVERGTDSADQPRETDLPAMDPQDVALADVKVGDWVATRNRNTGTSDGIVMGVSDLLDDDGARIGTRLELLRPGNAFGSTRYSNLLDSDNSTITRLIDGDQNTVLRIEEEKRRRARYSDMVQTVNAIAPVLESYDSDLAFTVQATALQFGSVRDENYESAVNGVFTPVEGSGDIGAQTLDNYRLRATGRLMTALQRQLSGESSGPEFEGVRDAASQLAEQIVNDHHERLRTGLLAVQATEPGQTRSAAGVALLGALQRGETSMERRDLTALANGIVDARYARAAAGAPDVDVAPAAAAVPEGGSLSTRMAAYKAQLSSRFGFSDASVTTFGDFDLDSLERGEVPELRTASARAKDRASDGGPGAQTMAQLEVLRAAGADLDAAIDARFSEQFPDPKATEAEAESAANAAHQEYDDLASQRTALFNSIRDQRARDRGFEDFADFEEVMMLLRRRDERDAYFTRNGIDPASITPVDAFRQRLDIADGIKDAPEYVALDERSNEAYLNYKSLDQRWRDVTARIREARAKAALDTLAEVRSMGGDPLPYVAAGRRKYEKTTKSQTNREYLNAMRFAEDRYPEEWLNALRNNGRGPLGLGAASDGRGWFEGTNWMLRLSAEDNRNGYTPWVPDRGRVAVHELGHAMEASVPGLAQAEEAFLWSRVSEGEVGSRTRGAGKRVDVSQAFKDDFAELYSGKDYGDGTHYELFTTGVESLFAGSAYLDDDYRRWLLGVMALI